MKNYGFFGALKSEKTVNLGGKKVKNVIFGAKKEKNPVILQHKKPLLRRLNGRNVNLGPQNMKNQVILAP